MREGASAIRITHQVDRGFTLVELMIALALGLVLLSSMYGVFETQNRSYTIQDQVAEMQQNVRTGMDMMIRDIRMAGYDPTRSAGAGIVSVSTGTIYITMDLNRDGTLDDSGEHLAYDMDSNTLRRSSGTSADVTDPGVAPYPEAVAEHIESLTFVHDTSANTVTITLTGRTARIDPDYTDPVYSDHYRRYTLEVTVIPRNLAAATTSTTSTSTSSTTSVPTTTTTTTALPVTTTTTTALPTTTSTTTTTSSTTTTVPPTTTSTTTTVEPPAPCALTVTLEACKDGIMGSMSYYYARATVADNGGHTVEDATVMCTFPGESPVALTYQSATGYYGGTSSGCLAGSSKRSASMHRWGSTFWVTATKAGCDSDEDYVELE